MAGSKVPRDPNISPEVRRFLDDLARVSNIFDGLTATEATALLNVFTSSLNGLVPASGGGTTTFLRADGSFAAPPQTSWTRASAGSVGTGTTFAITDIVAHTVAILQVADLSHNNGATQNFSLELSSNNGSSYHATAQLLTATGVGSGVMVTSTVIITHDGSHNYQVTSPLSTTGANSPTINLGAAMNALRLSPSAGNFDNGRAYLHVM